ncbi:MAG TPA: MmcQ/YjbR family DNA-binding protein [Chloroflexota bacterium]|nr:MmcQ/YjbR family DNA-binding protein [Chloroflexota bacterium]
MGGETDTDPLARLRAICLGLPEAIERETWGRPTFRIKEKIFAMMAGEHGVEAVWCKAPVGIQEILVGSDPERFFRPPYVGPKGWIGVRLDVEVDWEELTGFLEDSYRLIAPRRLAGLLDQHNTA